MPLRYLAIIVLTLALRLLTGHASAAAPRQSHPVVVKQTPAESIYSQRALRRARIILQLKLLELKSERLERVRRAILKHVPIDTLLTEGANRRR